MTRNISRPRSLSVSASRASWLAALPALGRPLEAVVAVCAECAARSWALTTFVAATRAKHLLAVAVHEDRAHPHLDALTR